MTDPSAPHITMKPSLLFCATDPGGARNLAPVAEGLKDGFNIHVLCSAQTFGIFSEMGISADITDIANVDAARSVIRDMGVTALVVGTSAADRPEAMLTQAAIVTGVPSVAILDEWYYYAARFTDHAGTFTHLPNVICCQDELAQAEAIAEGLPPEHLKITGSPALAETFARLHKTRHMQAPRPESHVPTVIFVSEQIAKAFGDAPGDKGFVSSFIGYTEKSVRKDIANMLNDIGVPCRVLEKLHPNETGTVTPPTHDAHIEWTMMAHDASLSDAMQDADTVIGMRSIALLEAAMRGFRPASYQPGRIGPDQCTAVRLGLSESLSTPSALKDWLKRAISGQHVRDINPDVPPFATPDATQNICDVIKSMCAETPKDEEC